MIDTNPTRHVSAVVLKSRKSLTSNIARKSTLGVPTKTKKFGKSKSQPISLDDPDLEISREEESSYTKKSEDRRIDLEEEEESEDEEAIA